MPNQAATSTYRWLDYLVWTVALWASFLNLLNFNHYPLFRAEVGLTLLALGLLGTLMAWCNTLQGRASRSYSPHCSPP